MTREKPLNGKGAGRFILPWARTWWARREAQGINEFCINHSWSCRAISLPFSVSMKVIEFCTDAVSHCGQLFVCSKDVQKACWSLFLMTFSLPPMDLATQHQCLKWFTLFLNEWQLSHLIFLSLKFCITKKSSDNNSMLLWRGSSFWHLCQSRRFLLLKGSPLLSLFSPFPSNF